MPMKAREETIDIHGYALREIREAKGRAVAELADALGVDRSYITRLELGHSRRVSRVFYSKLMAELDIRDHRVLYAVAPLRDAS
jgi:transcriptional regulator with XRE-family HTH domain